MPSIHLNQNYFAISFTFFFTNELTQFWNLLFLFLLLNIKSIKLIFILSHFKS